MAAYLQNRENRTWPEVRGVISHEKIKTLYFEKSGQGENAKAGSRKKAEVLFGGELEPGCRKSRALGFAVLLMRNMQRLLQLLLFLS